MLRSGGRRDRSTASKTGAFPSATWEREAKNHLALRIREADELNGGHRNPNLASFVGVEANPVLVHRLELARKCDADGDIGRKGAGRVTPKLHRAGSVERRRGESGERQRSNQSQGENDACKAGLHSGSVRTGERPSENKISYMRSRFAASQG